ncbi:MAG: hypothetical protein U1E35_06945 [Rhodospirillales bacterium]
MQVFLASWTDYWRLIIGIVIIALVVAFPRGIVGYVQHRIAPLLDRPEDGEPEGRQPKAGRP